MQTVYSLKTIQVWQLCPMQLWSQKHARSWSLFIIYHTLKQKAFKKDHKLETCGSKLSKELPGEHYYAG